MLQVTEELLKAITTTIVQTVDPERVILFGSQARGEGGNGSDLDLLIVEREPFGAGRSRWAETIRIRRALHRFAVPKDILVYSTDEMAQWKDSVNHIIARCLCEGKILYERP